MIDNKKLIIDTNNNLMCIRNDRKSGVYVNLTKDVLLKTIDLISVTWKEYNYNILLGRKKTFNVTNTCTIDDKLTLVCNIVMKFEIVCYINKTYYRDEYVSNYIYFTLSESRSIYKELRKASQIINAQENMQLSFI